MADCHEYLLVLQSSAWKRADLPTVWRAKICEAKPAQRLKGTTMPELTTTLAFFAGVFFGALGLLSFAAFGGAPRDSDD